MEKIAMKVFATLLYIAIWTSLVEAGQLLSAYNLISPQQYIVPQTYAHSSLGVVHPSLVSTLQPQRDVLAHPTVVETSIAESGLPRELSKSNDFYSNPYIASALATESLKFNKEFPVYDRPSEKIPREEIVKLINNLHRVHHGNK